MKTRYPSGERDFHADWFQVDVPEPKQAVRALILDDTWTTGSRAQSLAYALKSAGAESVVTIVPGRHVNPDYEPSRQLLSAIDEPIFDLSRCVAEDAR